MDKEKYIGQSKMGEAPEKSLRIKLKDACVKPEHLDDSVKTDIIDPIVERSAAALTERIISSNETLDNKYALITKELYEMIESLQVGGVALSNQFGDREDIGITQKTLTKAIGRIWDELSQITGHDYFQFTMTAVPEVTYSEDPVTVTITVDCTGAVKDFDLVRIYINDELFMETSGVTTLTTTAVITKTSEIKAVGTIFGKEITKTQTVIEESPFFMGSGTQYTDIVNDECHRDIDGTLEGDYDLTVRHTGEHIFIIIPLSRKDEFRRADMNGYEIPLQRIPSEQFVVYKSVNVYRAGTYNIDIDINT